ncbi:MAG TPA: pitrilysin family protein [Chloroflexota bacterium]
MTDSHSQGSPFPTHTLANGLRIVAQPMGGVESLALGFCVATGARDEEEHEAGASHFIDGLAFQGTAIRDTRALTEAFEDLGARRDASAGTELFWYAAQALGRHMDVLVPLMAEVVRRPRFDPEEAEKVRDRQLQEIAALEDEPAQKVLDLLQREYFHGHPYGRSVLGTPASVRALQPADLRAFWTRTQLPNNTIVAAAGKLDFDRLVTAVEAACGDWEPGGLLPLPEAPATKPRVSVVVRESNQQHIGIGVAGVPVGHPDYYAVALLATILGGSMNSRLFTEVREKRGLAYGVGAASASMRDAGMIRIYAGTVPAKAHETVAVTLDELRKLESGGVSDGELSRAKTVIKSRVVMGGENTRVRRNVIASSLWYENKVRTLDEIRALIDAVTAPQIQEAAVRLQIGSRYTLTAIGPRSAEELLGNEQ